MGMYDSWDCINGTETETIQTRAMWNILANLLASNWYDEPHKIGSILQLKSFDQFSE